MSWRAWLAGALLAVLASPAGAAESGESGKAAYEHSCLQCHGANLQGGEFGPALKGAAFNAKWSAQPTDALLRYMVTKMPPSGPGTLATSEYTAIEAFVRQVNEQDQQSARLFSAAVEHDATWAAVHAGRTALLERMSAVTEAQLRSPPPGDWLHWRRTWDALGFSPLAQIDAGNVHSLGTAWSWTLPASANQITPLVHDGVLFVASGPSVEALDAASGDRLWQYVRILPDEFDGGRGARMKSLAMLGDKLYAATADGHVVALDSSSGALAWDHAVIPPEQGPRKNEPDGAPLRLDSGLVVARGKVVAGVSLGVSHGKGGAYIVALDAASGNEAWRFDTIARPGQPGGDSWNGRSLDERYGAGVWIPGSYDPELDLLYFGTGNTYATASLLVPDPTERPSNRALYTDSTLALDPATGKLAWYYQHLARDVWDLDWSFERSLLTLPLGGNPRRVVVTGGKMALFDVLDRATGEYLFSRDFGLQNVVQEIDPKTGAKHINPEVQPEAGKSKLVCPHATAGRNWPATSIDPESGILYVPLAESCMNHTFTPGTPAETAAGGVDAAMEQRVRPDTDGKFGRLQAMDLATGKTLWTQRQRATPSSATLATAGGIVFAGDHDRWFRAYDAKSGAKLWETRLNAPPYSYPVTYAVDGEQYVAVVAGGGSALAATRAQLTPEIDTAAGNPVLFVFSLRH